MVAITPRQKGGYSYTPSQQQEKIYPQQPRIYPPLQEEVLAEKQTLEQAPPLQEEVLAEQTQEQAPEKAQVDVPEVYEEMQGFDGERAQKQLQGLAEGGGEDDEGGC